MENLGFINYLFMLSRTGTSSLDNRIQPLAMDLNLLSLWAMDMSTDYIIRIWEKIGSLISMFSFKTTKSCSK